MSAEVDTNLNNLPPALARTLFGKHVDYYVYRWLIEKVKPHLRAIAFECFVFGVAGVIWVVMYYDNLYLFWLGPVKIATFIVGIFGFGIQIERLRKKFGLR